MVEKNVQERVTNVIPKIKIKEGNTFLNTKLLIFNNFWCDQNNKFCFLFLPRFIFKQISKDR